MSEIILNSDLFNSIVRERKRFFLLKQFNNFRVGNHLKIYEFKNGVKNKRFINVMITYIERDTSLFGLLNEFYVIGFEIDNWGDS